jgi:hypothetical protein
MTYRTLPSTSRPAAALPLSPNSEQQHSHDVALRLIQLYLYADSILATTVTEATLRSLYTIRTRLPSEAIELVSSSTLDSSPLRTYVKTMNNRLYNSDSFVQAAREAVVGYTLIHGRQRPQTAQTFTVLDISDTEMRTAEFEGVSSPPPIGSCRMCDGTGRTASDLLCLSKPVSGK